MSPTPLNTSSSSSKPIPTPTHLIIVCCHAIYTGPSSRASSPSSASVNPSNWLLAPFQKDEVPTFISHIKTGVSLLTASPPGRAILVFSGSKTRPEVDLSEARSYLRVCEREGWWGLMDEDMGIGSKPKPIPTPEKKDQISTLDSVTDAESGEGRDEDGRGREKQRCLRDYVYLEEQALDSFHNILFSLLLFQKRALSWPERVTVISHAFKRARFVDLHIPALRFPVNRVEYVGIDPEYMSPEKEDGSVNGGFDGERAHGVRMGERERGYGAWEVDGLGVREGLRRKRAERDFWDVSQVWFEGEEGEKRRERSGVKSRRVEWRFVDRDGREKRVVEEVLGEEGRQPWEED
ncbi:hypothetical protein WAI453_000222 [Rhynchosporium graminicola]